MSPTAPDQSIAEAHFRCIDAFEALIGATNAQPALHSAREQGLSLEDVFDKYKLWSGNVGAMHSGQKWKLSLDYRLREAAFYKEQVLRLVNGLQSSIETALSMHLNANNSINSGVKGDVEAEDVVDDDSPWEVSSDSEAGHTDNRPVERSMATSKSANSVLIEPNKPRAGFAASLDLIDHIVSCLWRLPVRRPAPLERIKGSASASTPYQPFDIMHVVDKFPMIEKELAVRLGRMISRRRQLLRYRNRHATALHGKHLTARRPIIDVHSDSGEDNFECTTSITASTQHTRDTKATTLMLDQQNHVLPEIGELFAPSVASNSSSIMSQNSDGETTIKVPQRPKDVDGKALEQFMCPYCQTAQTISSNRKWRKHVLSDLQPYVCTYPECSLRDHVFNNIADWFQHETHSHRLEWTCNTDGHGAFATTDGFLNHMKSSHHQDIREDQLQVLRHTFQQPTRSLGGVCTLCGKVSGRLKSHISQHLHQLALFAIPQTDFLDESDNGNVDSDIAHLSQISHSNLAGNKETPNLAEDTAGVEMAQEDASAETQEDYNSIPPAPEAEIWDYIAPKFQEARAALNESINLEDTKDALQDAAKSPSTSTDSYTDRTTEEQQTKMLASIRPEDVVIAVMGSGGSGKTTFINFFANDHQLVNHSMDDISNRITIHPCSLPDRTRFYLVEIPELGAASRSGVVAWTHIAKWLNDAYSSRLLFCGIVYLHRISGSRISGSVVRSLRLFEHLCGEDNFANVVLATTMWDSEDLVVAASREKELMSRLWKHMIGAGSKVMRQYANQESAAGIVEGLMVRQRRMALNLQVQLADRGFSATDVGHMLEQDLVEQRRKLIELRLGIAQDMARAPQNGDDVRYFEKEIIALNKVIKENDQILQLLSVVDHELRVHVRETEPVVQESGKHIQRDATTAESTSHQDSQSKSSNADIVAPSSTHAVLNDAYSGDRAVMNPYHQQRPLCGASIGAYRGEHLPPVSLGGIIMVDGEPYGLTVHHILDAPSDDESDGEDAVVNNNEDDVGKVSLGGSIQDLRSVRPGSADASEAAASTAIRTSAGGSGVDPLLTGRGTQPGVQFNDSGIPPLWDLELSDDERASNGSPGDENVEFKFSDSDFDSDASKNSIKNEDHAQAAIGDIQGIAPGNGEEIKITQPAIDDVDEDLFPDDDGRDEEHLSRHELGYIYASSGIRRWNRNGILHEIDWALIKIRPDRLQPYNVVQGGRRFHFNTTPHPDRSPLSEPVDRRHYKPEEDEYPSEVVSADSLGGLNVHCFGRTTGLQGGMIGPSMTQVRIYRRQTFSRSWHVAGGFGVGGDTGAWVIQNGTGFVCGVVLAWCERNQIAYIMPMEVILEDIKRTLGATAVYLPGSNAEKKFQAKATSSARKYDSTDPPHIPSVVVDKKG